MAVNKSEFEMDKQTDILWFFKLKCHGFVIGYYTVWKFYDFAINQILREINFEDFRSAKFTVLNTFRGSKF